MEVYNCDPTKNAGCSKTSCYMNGGPCYQTLYKEFAMENEIRYYLRMMLECMKKEEGFEDTFEPQYIVTAVKLPTGAIEIAVNNIAIKEKIEYILYAYDDDMRLKSNPEIVMQNVMVV